MEREFVFPRIGTGKIEYEDATMKVPALIEKKDGKPATASRIYLPAEWAGKHVLCLLVTDNYIEVPAFLKVLNLPSDEQLIVNNLPSVRERVVRLSKAIDDKKN